MSAKNETIDKLQKELEENVVDMVVLSTGPRAYRRPDGVAVIPLALLGP